MLNAFFAYCLFLAATIVLEGIVVGIVAPAPLRRRALAVCVAANLFTHPVATLLMWRWSADFLAIEALVAMFEFGCYVRIVPLATVRAFGLAVVANFLTMCAGIFWWAWGLT